jgi:hypothetical protein
VAAAASVSDSESAADTIGACDFKVGRLVTQMSAPRAAPSVSTGPEQNDSDRDFTHWQASMC